MCDVTMSAYASYQLRKVKSYMVSSVLFIMFAIDERIFRRYVFLLSVVNKRVYLPTPPPPPVESINTPESRINPFVQTIKITT